MLSSKQKAYEDTVVIKSATTSQAARKNHRAILKISDLQKPSMASRQSTTSIKGTPLLKQNPVSGKDRLQFSRVLAQVKLLEDNGNNGNLIRTLQKQAKILNMSRKKILKSSNSMSDY